MPRHVKAKLPKDVLWSVRIPRRDHMLLIACQQARGDESRSDTLRAAVRMFVDHYVTQAKRGKP